MGKKETGYCFPGSFGKSRGRERKQPCIHFPYAIQNFQQNSLSLSLPCPVSPFLRSMAPGFPHRFIYTFSPFSSSKSPLLSALEQEEEEEVFNGRSDLTHLGCRSAALGSTSTDCLWKVGVYDFSFPVLFRRWDLMTLFEIRISFSFFFYWWIWVSHKSWFFFLLVFIIFQRNSGDLATGEARGGDLIAAVWDCRCILRVLAFDSRSGF